MGTNYYVQEKKCKCCGHRKQDLHIGKKSSGWSFSFHATDELMTFEDWVEFLIDKTIVDECGDEIQIYHFVQMVINSKDGRNQTLYCREHHGEHARKNCFLDPEGYSFQRGEFC